MLVLPAEATHACLAGRLQDGDLDGLSVDPSLADARLLRGDCRQRLVVDRFDEAVAERIESRPEGPDGPLAGTCSCASGVSARSSMMERPEMVAAPSSIGTVGFTNVPLASR